MAKANLGSYSQAHNTAFKELNDVSIQMTPQDMNVHSI